MREGGQSRRGNSRKKYVACLAETRSEQKEQEAEDKMARLFNTVIIFGV